MACVQSHEVGRAVAVLRRGETREASVGTHLVDRHVNCRWKLAQGIWDGTRAPLRHGGMAKEQFEPAVAVEVGDGNVRLCRGKGTEMKWKLVRCAEGGELIFPDLLGIGNRVELCLRTGSSGGRRRKRTCGKRCDEVLFERNECHRHTPFDLLDPIGETLPRGGERRAGMIRERIGVHSVSTPFLAKAHPTHAAPLRSHQAGALDRVRQQVRT